MDAMHAVRPMAVSVIIPCYRQAQYLAQAIDSVLEQTYPNVEVIVVNDGSDDETEEVARSYGNRVRYIRRNNGGLSAARNTGFEAATGEWVVFLDADDWLLPGMVETLLRLVGQAGTPAAFGGHIAVASDGETELWRQEPRAASLSFTDFQAANPLPVHTVLICRALVVDAGGFDESLRACEDWDLWARLTRNGLTLAGCPDALACYRMVPASMSRDPLVMLRAVLTVLDRYCPEDLKPMATAKWAALGLGSALAQANGTAVRDILGRYVPRELLAPRVEIFLEYVAAGFARARCVAYDRAASRAPLAVPFMLLLPELVSCYGDHDVIRRALGWLAETDRAAGREDSLRSEVTALRGQVALYRDSTSYRIGRWVTRLNRFKRG